MVGIWSAFLVTDITRLEITVASSSLESTKSDPASVLVELDGFADSKATKITPKTIAIKAPSATANSPSILRRI